VSGIQRKWQNGLILGGMPGFCSKNELRLFRKSSRMRSILSVTLPCHFVIQNEGQRSLLQEYITFFSFFPYLGLFVGAQNIFHFDTEAIPAALEVFGPSALCSGFHTVSLPFPDGFGRQDYCVHPNMTGPDGSAGRSLLRDHWI